MDRAMIEDHLGQAERHVALGIGHIAQQKEIIAGLDAKGLDSTEAQSLLQRFEETQVEHVAHRDRLRKELAGLG